MAYYPFNGNAQDESGNDVHAGVSGARLALDRFNNKNSAYAFLQQSDQVSTKPFGKAFDKFTFSVWSFPVGRKEGESHHLLIEQVPAGPRASTPSSHKYRGLYYDQDRSHIRFHYGDRWFDTNGIIKKNEWVQCVGTWDGTVALIYINGQLSAKFKHTGSSIKADGYNTPVTIGSGRGSESYTAGSIDDVRIYNRALSAEEVKALYDLEKPKGK